jgi:putative oxidoreductase
METTAETKTGNRGGGFPGLVRSVYCALSWLAPVAQLAARLWVANVFIKSGLTKIQSFSTTIQLFKYEYSVPLLPPEVAAYMGTFTELFFPVFLALGLGGRPAAVVLFVFNIIAVISYPELGSAGREQHLVWGILLLMTVTHGPGKLSLDHWIARRFGWLGPSGRCG